MTGAATIPEALTARAQTIAGILAPRVNHDYGGPGAWAGYVAEEGLKATLATVDSVRFERFGRPGARLVMGFLAIARREWAKCPGNRLEETQ